MKRFIALFCIMILTVFIASAVFGADSDPPCAELYEITNQTTEGNSEVTGDFSQYFPNPFNLTAQCTINLAPVSQNTTISGAEHVEKFEERMPETATLLSMINLDNRTSAGLSTQDENIMLAPYGSIAEYIAVFAKTPDNAGQYPKALVDGAFYGQD